MELWFSFNRKMNAARSRIRIAAILAAILIAIELFCGAWLGHHVYGWAGAVCGFFAAALIIVGMMILETVRAELRFEREERENH